MCISYSERCDGINDCGDNTDEIGCGKWLFWNILLRIDEVNMLFLDNNIILVRVLFG